MNKPNKPNFGTFLYGLGYDTSLFKGRPIAPVNAPVKTPDAKKFNFLPLIIIGIIAFLILK